MRSTLTRLLGAGQTERLRRRGEPQKLGAIAVGVATQRRARRRDHVAEARRALVARVFEQQPELGDRLLELGKDVQGVGDAQRFQSSRSY